MKPRMIEKMSRTTLSGFITKEDVLKAFRLPPDAELTVVIPSGFAGDSLEIGGEAGSDPFIPHINVSWTQPPRKSRKKKGDVVIEQLPDNPVEEVIEPI